jgi:hypothetical protein
MEITLHIPDEIARQVDCEETDVARVALEALAIEGYRAEKLSETAVKRMLGFDSRLQVHAFLKEQVFFFSTVWMICRTTSRHQRTLSPKCRHISHRLADPDKRD